MTCSYAIWVDGGAEEEATRRPEDVRKKKDAYNQRWGYAEMVYQDMALLQTTNGLQLCTALLGGLFFFFLY